MGFETTKLAEILREDIKPGDTISIQVNFDDWHCNCGCKSFNVLYDPYRFKCLNCGEELTSDQLRDSVGG